MQKSPPLLVLAAVAAFLLGGCDVVDNSRQAAAKPQNPPRDLAPEERKALGVDYRLVVEDVAGGSSAAASPIQPGDVILAVNQDRFRSVEEFNKLVAKRKKGENVALLVRRGEASVYVPIEIGTS